jgi:hypothetical protein
MEIICKGARLNKSWNPTGAIACKQCFPKIKPDALEPARLGTDTDLALWNIFGLSFPACGIASLDNKFSRKSR